mmetsp:Transcript_50730/g.130859  ORF Transcript_50730/g.130859 Transcript_50730/m.130859 type:complete len:125 (-) Transcript_50730:106-480(-)
MFTHTHPPPCSYRIPARLWRIEGGGTKPKVVEVVEIPISLTRKGEPRPACFLHPSSSASAFVASPSLSPGGEGEEGERTGGGAGRGTGTDSSPSVYCNFDGEGDDFALPLPEGASGIIVSRSVL